MKTYKDYINEEVKYQDAIKTIALMTETQLRLIDNLLIKYKFKKIGKKFVDGASEGYQYFRDFVEITITNFRNNPRMFTIPEMNDFSISDSKGVNKFGKYNFYDSSIMQNFTEKHKKYYPRRPIEALQLDYTDLIKDLKVAYVDQLKDLEKMLKTLKYQ